MSGAAAKKTAPPPRDAGLSEDGKRRLAEIRAQNALIVAINNESWGKKLSPLQQRAFAEYMRRFRLDISEVDNLGGRPYRNGRYYMRRLMELVRQGRIEEIRTYHIGPDERLDFAASEDEQWAKDESDFRLKERIRFAVPPDATHAYVVAIKFKALTRVIEGCKWYVPGRTKLGWSKEQRGVREEVPADPVGDENPVESVETRAWRRAGRIAAAEIPELGREEQYMDAEAEIVEEEGAESVARDEATAEGPPAPIVGQLTEGPMQPLDVSQAERASVQPDPYSDELPLGQAARARNAQLED